MAIPNLLNEVEKAMTENLTAWKNAHTGNEQTETFIKILAKSLHKKNPKFGLNGKRGNPSDLSDDCVNYLGEGLGHDPLTNQPCTIIDVIGAAGGPNPRPIWEPINQPGPGAWVKPGDVLPPQPPAKPTYPSYESLGGDEGGKRITRLLENDYKTAKGFLDGECGAWIQRVAYDFLVGNYATIEDSIRVHQLEWRVSLNQERINQGKPPITSW